MGELDQIMALLRNMGGQQGQSQGMQRPAPQPMPFGGNGSFGAAQGMQRGNGGQGNIMGMLMQMIHGGMNRQQPPAMMGGTQNPPMGGMNDPMQKPGGFGQPMPQTPPMGAPNSFAGGSQNFNEQNQPMGQSLSQLARPNRPPMGQAY